MTKIHKYILNILFLFVTIILLSPILISMNFPIELEVRESTLWLHILTIKEGINIYDQNIVAYANQAHGPIDPLFKFIIHKTLFFLEPWQVSRLNNILFFFSIFLINYQILNKKNDLKIILFISVTIYSLIFLFTKTFQGRADVTAMLLISYLSFLCVDKNFYKNNVKLILVSFLFSIIFMTNWRFLPLCLAISFFPIFCSDNLKDIFSKKKILILLKYFIFASIPLLLLLVIFFNFDTKKYFDYFIGFFYFESFFTYDHYLKGFYQLIRVEKIYFLIILTSIYLIKFYKKNDLIFHYVIKILISLLVFLSCLISFLYNYVGGGIYYFTPVIFFLWYLILFEYKNNNLDFSLKNKINIYIILISIIIILSATKNSVRSYFSLNSGYSDALELHKYLKSLNSKSKSVLSESLHFHKEKYSGEKIDIGDLISYRAFQVGGKYEETYLSHLNEIKNKKYKYIIHNFTGSKIINDLIKNGNYKIIKKFKKNISNIGEILILERVN